MPSFDGGDDAIWIGGPGEGFGIFIGLSDEAIDGCLEIDEGVKDPTFEPSPCEFVE